MFSLLITLLIWILVLGLIYWLVITILAAIPNLPPQVFLIVKIVFILFLILIIVGVFFEGSGVPIHRFRFD
jgi:hypothetical protein